MPTLANKKSNSQGLNLKNKVPIISDIRQKIKEKNDKRALNHRLAAARYGQVSKGTNVLDLIKDEIQEASKTLSSKVENSVVQLARNKFGYHGGMLKDKQKTSSAGYDIRRFLKDRTRNWANDQVEKESTTYQQETYSQINGQQISDEEKQKKKGEFDKTQNVRNTFFKANLYKALKSDVLYRIDKQCIDVAQYVNKKLESKYNNLIKIQMEKVFKEQFEVAFYKEKSKGSTLSDSDIENIAKDHAANAIKLNINKIADVVYSLIQEELNKESAEYIATKRDEIAKSLGGKKVAERYDFKAVNANDFSSVENYVYEKDDAKAQVSGIKPLKEIKEDIAQKTRGNAIITNDINRGLRYFSKAAFSLVHNNGDTASLETAFKIPVSPGVFFNIKVTGSVEKDDNHVTGKVNLGVGASGEVGIAKLAGEVGGYMEIKAKNPEDFAKLISYTLYRQFRESKVIPTSLTNKIWGMGGISGKSKYEEAEAFGASMETSLFGENVEEENQSKIGAYGKFSGEVGVPDTSVGLSFEVKGGAAREYSKNAFEQTNQKNRIGQMESYKFGGQTSKGQITGNLSLTFEVGAFIGGGSATLELKFRSGKIESVAIKMGGKLKYAGSDLNSESLKETISMAVNSASSFLNSVVKGGVNINRMMKNTSNATEISQMIMGDAGQVVFQSFQTGFTGNHLNDMLAQVEGSSLSNISEGSLGLELAYEWSPGSGGTFSASLATTSSAGINFGVGSLKAEKAQRILKWASNGTGNTMFEKFKGGLAFI